MGVGRRVPIVAGCDEGEKPASRTGEVTSRGEGDNVLGIKGSNPAFALDCVPVDERMKESQPTSEAGPAASVTKTDDGGAVSTGDGEDPRQLLPTSSVDGYAWEVSLVSLPTLACQGSHFGCFR